MNKNDAFMRDQNIDIYKGLLIFLVVFGHCLERFLGWQNELGKMFLQCIYLVHMPAFIFISGIGLQELWRLVTKQSIWI